jgi:ZipA-like protein with FtsZ-binding domain
MNEKELEQFAAEYDAQVSINIRVDGAKWKSDDFLGALGRGGFHPSSTGKLTLAGNNALTAKIKADGICLVLDVPFSSPDEKSFEQMTACAKSLANAFDGTLVDDAGKPLSDSAITEIASQIAQFYAGMEAFGIPAGSEKALLLFGAQCCLKDGISRHVH